jgi:hypothetical protein
MFTATVGTALTAGTAAGTRERAPSQLRRASCSRLPIGCFGLCSAGRPQSFSNQDFLSASHAADDVNAMTAGTSRKRGQPAGRRWFSNVRRSRCSSSEEVTVRPRSFAILCLVTVFSLWALSREGIACRRGDGSCRQHVRQTTVRSAFAADFNLRLIGRCLAAIMTRTPGSSRALLDGRRGLGRRRPLCAKKRPLAGNMRISR